MKICEWAQRLCIRHSNRPFLRCTLPANLASGCSCAHSPACAAAVVGTRCACAPSWKVGIGVPGLFTRRWLILSLAALLTLATAVYSCIWAYYIRTLPEGRIGVTFSPFLQGSQELDLIR